MKKRKILGGIMLTLGIVYMFLMFAFVEAFEKINDTVAFVMTIISVCFIIFGGGMLFIKNQEEHIKEEIIKREENLKLKKYYKYKPFFTYIIISVNILVFIMNNYTYGNDEILKYAISRKDFEFYKLFTSIFTHSNETHIIANMFALYLCGSKLESLIGNIKYLFVYILSGLGSSLLIVLFANYPCVGASGAILGLYGCYLFIAFKNRNIMKYTFKYDLLPTIIIILFETFIVPNISEIGHIGGLLFGIILGCIFCRKLVLK